MSNIQLQQPADGTNTTINPQSITSINLDFSPENVLLTRENDDLVFSFEAGAEGEERDIVSSIRINNFYIHHDEATLPDFIVEDAVVPGKEFFAAFNEELMPAAGENVTDAYREGHFHHGELLDGIHRIGRLDQEYDDEHETYAQDLSAASANDTADDTAEDITAAEQVPESNAQAARPPGPSVADTSVPSHAADPDTVPNSAPTIDTQASTLTLSVVEAGILPDGTTQTDGTPTASGTLVATDVDNDTLRYSLVSASSDASHDTASTITGQYGTFTLNKDGSYTYTLDNENPDTNALNQAHVVTETFTVRVSDGSGGSVEQDVTVSVSGTNDAPHLSLSLTQATLKEDADVNSAKGNVTVLDPDADGDSLNEQRLSVNDSSASRAGDNVSYEGQYGTFELDGSTGEYTYTLGVTDEQQARVDALDEGESVEDVFLVRTTDAHNAAHEDTITVTVEGTNDAPRVSLENSVVALDLVEQGVLQGGNEATEGVPEMFGQLVVSDAEGDAVTFRIYNEDAHEGNTYTTEYGTFTLNEDGSYTYVLHNDNAATNALNAGDIREDRVTIIIDDGKGGTVTQDISLTVTGTNDQPFIDIEAYDSTVQEDTDNMTAQGIVHVHDPDADDTPLSEQTLSVSHAGNARISATEAGGTVTVEGEYGTLVIDGHTGEYTYTLGVTEEQQARVDVLADGDTPKEHFTIRTTDAHGAYTEQSIDMTVRGTNDTPVIEQADTQLSVTEAGVIAGGNTRTDGSDTDGGRMEVSDREGQQLSYGLVGADDSSSNTMQGEYGTFTVHEDGSYIYELDNDNQETSTLNNGQSAEEEFTIVITDSEGAQVQQTVRVDVQGTNDQPIISIDARDSVVKEDTGNKRAWGMVDVADPDTDGDALSEQTLSINGIAATTAGGNVTVEGEYGTLVLNGQTGRYTYTIGVTEEQQARVDVLVDGDKPKESFTFRTTDAHGAYTEQSIDITVRGKNDTPDIEHADTRLSVTEAGVLLGGNVATDGIVSDGGRIEASDAEGHSISFGLVGAEDNVLQGQYGTFTLNEDGSYSYQLDNDNAELDALNPGDIRQESFTVSVTDSEGARVQQVIRVDVMGTNDIPSIGVTQFDNHVAENSPDRRASGRISIADTDSDDNALSEQSLSVSHGGDTGTSASTAGGDVVHEGMYGNIVIDGASGAYIYTLGVTAEQQARVEALGDETATEDFTVRTTDKHGAYSEEQLSINITGKNDAPVINKEASVTQVTVTEEGVHDAQGDPNAAFAGMPTASGVIVASDVEGSDVGFRLVGAGSSDDGAHKSSTVTGVYGTITLNPDGSYTYALDNGDVHTQMLNAGAKTQDVFSVQVSDGEGGVTVQNIVVHIGGTNDKPELAVISTDTRVQENSIDMLASGVLAATDSDTDGDRIAKQVISVDGQSAAQAGENITVQGEYGNITFYGDTGAYLYTLGVTKEQQQRVKKLDAGESVRESFDVRVTDTHGAFAEESVTINVYGNGNGNGQCTVRREALVIDLEATEGGVLDDGHTIDEGIPLTQGYILPANAHSKVQSLSLGSHDAGEGGGEEKGTFGTLTLNPNGTYVYILNNAHAETQALSRGEQATESFTINVHYKDGSVKAEEVRVVVTGTNDKPILHVEPAPDAQGTLVEDGMVTSVNGTIVVNDPDADAQLGAFRVNNTEAIAGEDLTVDGTYGTLVIDAGTGEYSYTIGSTAAQKARLDSLGEGQSVTEDFVVRNTDTHGAFGEAPLSFTIEGTNDAPVVNAAQSVLTLSVMEAGLGEGGLPFTQGFLVASDVDGDKLSFSPVGTVGAEGGGSFDMVGAYGTFTLYEDGSYVYTLNNALASTEALAQGEQAQDIFTVNVNDSHGGTYAQDITVTVTGSNDAPVLDVAQSTFALDLVEAGVNIDGEDIFVAGTPFAEGRISVSDVDGDALTYTLVNGAQNMLQGTYGTFVLHDDGTFNYTLNNDGANHLRQDAVYEESFFITVEDGKGGLVSTSVSVSVTGTNDIPSIEVSQELSSLTEDMGAQSLSGAILIEDADSDGHEQALTVSVNDTAVAAQEDGSVTVAGTYGTLVLMANGEYTYTLGTTAEQQAQLETLDEGDAHDELFHVRTEDSHGAAAEATIAITVHGTDDIFQTGNMNESLLSLNTEHDSATLSAPQANADPHAEEDMLPPLTSEEILSDLADSVEAHLESEAAPEDLLAALDNSGEMEPSPDMEGTDLTADEARELESMDVKDVLTETKVGMETVLDGAEAKAAEALADEKEETTRTAPEEGEVTESLWDENVGGGVVDVDTGAHHEDAAVLAAKVHLETGTAGS